MEHSPSSTTAVSDKFSESFALLLKVASAEYAGLETEFGVPIVSPHGHDVIPLLVQANRGEIAVYVEAGPWISAAEEKYLRWLGLLRTSPREDVEVHVRSNVDVPARLKFYSSFEPRVLFEVAAIPQVAWVNVPGFARENVAVLRRLAIEYLDVELPDGIAGLDALDCLVVDTLRQNGQGDFLPWTACALGSFFGETLISLFGGRWSIEGRRLIDAKVEMTSPTGAIVKADVFGKVLKLLDHGIADSTAWMARAIESSLAGSPDPPLP